MKALPRPWRTAMEDPMFTGWIYDHLKPHTASLKVAHPLMLGAIWAAKKKNDRIDDSKICDCLRCNVLPELECNKAPLLSRSARSLRRKKRTCPRFANPLLCM
jgi:hypothetical protein